MDKKEIYKLPDYYRRKLERNKIRFKGIGPRLQGRPNGIWPRDCIDSEDEIRKTFSHDLTASITDEVQLIAIKDVIKKLFEGFKTCNIQSLFNRFCPLPQRHFNEVPFNVAHALDAYSDYSDVLVFIHHVLRSLNNIKTRGHHQNFLLFLFGTNRNFEIYKSHLRWLVIGNAKMLHLDIANLISFHNVTVDLSAMRWLEGLDFIQAYCVFYKVIHSITRFISELLSRYFYITVSNPYCEKLFYFRYDLWQKIQSKVIKDMIYSRILEPVELTGSLTTRFKHNSSSKLKFHLKKDGLRPISTRSIERTTNAKTYVMMDVLAYILDKMPNYKKFKMTNLLKGLKRFRRLLVQENKKIYFVRADIKDCFQSINQQLLRDTMLRILQEHWPDNVIHLTKFSLPNHQRTFRNRKLKHVVYSFTPDKFERDSLLSYERYPMDIPVDTFMKEYLEPEILRPVLRGSRKSKNGLILESGLRQGSSFSPRLCSIYIQAAFNEDLEDYLDVDDCQIYQYADDILFISTDLDKSKVFMHKMLNGFARFNLKMNLNKLACNFNCQVSGKNICNLENYLVFYKQRIWLDTLACSYHYSYKHVEIQYTFTSNPYFSTDDIKNAMRRWTLNLIHFDLELNGFDMVMKNIFERAMLIAHRVAASVIISIELSKLENQDGNRTFEFLCLTASKIRTGIKGGVNRGLITNDLSYQEIFLLVLAAYYVTWNRNKMRHRTVELDRISKKLRRQKEQYLICIPKNANFDAIVERRTRFEKMMNQLIGKFRNSCFEKEILLPTKKQN